MTDLRILEIEYKAPPNDEELVTYDSAAGVWIPLPVSSLLDPDLNAIASIPGTSGILCKTAANTWALRTLTGTTDELTVSEGAGVGGNPTLSFASEHRGGWIPSSGADTFAYASATTITTNVGSVARYAVGDKLRLVQSGSTKYFYVVAVADTLLTITGGTDYTLINAAISNFYFSHAISPAGFPGRFLYTPTLTFSGGMTLTGATNSGTFSMQGKVVDAWIKSTGGTLVAPAGTDVYPTLPVTAESGYIFGCGYWLTDSAYAGIGHAFGNSTTTLGLRKATVVNWGLGAGFGFNINARYLAA